MWSNKKSRKKSLLCQTHQGQIIIEAAVAASIMLILMMMFSHIIEMRNQNKRMLPPFADKKEPKEFQYAK